MSVLDAVSFGIEMGKVVLSVFVKVKDDCRDTMFTGHLVNKLSDELDLLRDKREPILERFNASFITADDIEPQVRSWLDNANAAVQKAEKIVADYERLLSNEADSPGCMPGIMQRRLIGSSAHMQKLVIRLCNMDDMEFDDDPCSSWLKTNSPNEYISFSSREPILKEIMECVRSSDGDLFIGVCGAGGMGKTTLAQQVYRVAKEDFFIGKVAMATVTQKVDVWRIQEELAATLGITLEGDAEVKQRADLLINNLWNSKALIILDDLWGAIDLEEVGIPSELGIKFLFTSRSEKALKEMGSAKLIYHLRALTDVDARTLFENAVGKEAVLLDPNQTAIGIKLVEKCDGVPISIKALAAMLSSRDHPNWQDALEKLSQSDDAYYSTMEFCYQHLIGDGLKSLFLSCAVVNCIPTRDVLAYSMGLGLFEGIKRVKRVRFRLQTLVSRLQESSLIDIGCSSVDRDYIKMHDTVHEIAIKIAAKEGRHAFVAKSGSELEEFPAEKLRECTAISLPFVHINNLPQRLMENEFPKLEIFILIVKGKSPVLPHMLFQGMKKLKVLHLSQLSFTSLPSSIRVLHNLSTLLLDGCVGINDKDMMIIGGLTRLQILSLRGSSVKYLPKEVGGLSELRLLDLSNCGLLQKIEPGVLQSLLHLEELYMENSFVNWEADGVTTPSNAKIEELTGLPDLTVLHIHVPDIAMLPEDPAMITQLDKFQILIGGSCDWLRNQQVSRTLKLNGDSRGILLQELVQATLDRTEELHLDGVKGTPTKSLHQLSVEGFHQVKRLHVRNSPLIGYVLQSVQRTPPVPSFEKLEMLCLKDLDNLEQVCHGPPPKLPDSFTQLKFLNVSNCRKLKNLFSASLVIHGFAELEEIVIRECRVMKGIVQVEVDHGHGEEKKIKPCNLRRLKLEDLPEFTAFCTKADDHTSPRTSSLPISDNDPATPCALFDCQQVSFPKLESLLLSGIGKLKEIWPHRRQSMEFGDLRCLEVRDCGSLSLCIPSGVLPSLKKLESLTIAGCSSMKQLLDIGRLDCNEEILPQLKELTMVNLPNLTSILTNNAAAPLTIFKKLKHVKVERCGSLTNVFSLATAQELRQLKILTVARCEKLEAVILADEEFPKERMSKANKTTLILPMLELLNLDRLPVLATFVQFRRVSTEPSACFFSPKVSLPRLEALVLHYMQSITSIWPDELLSEESFSRFRMLKISKCDSLSSSLVPPTLMKKLQNLEEVVVGFCAALEVIFDCGSSGGLHNHNSEALMLPKLFRLGLQYLTGLRCIVQGLPLGLPSLKKIKLRNCEKLIDLFPSGIARTLLELESIDIDGCKCMEQVVSIEDDCGEEQVLAPISFPHLRSLKLGNLNSLICFSSGGCLFEFPSLEDLQLRGSSKLKTFIMQRPALADDGALNSTIHSLFDDKVEFPKLNNLCLVGVSVQKVWNDNEQLPLDSFLKLKSLDIKSCENLETVVTPNMFRRLQNLETLSIKECSALHEVVSKEDGGEEQVLAPMSFPNLRVLELGGLGRMKYFWSGGSLRTSSHSLFYGKVVVPNLERMRLYELNLHKVWNDEVHYPLDSFSKLKYLAIEKCPNLGTIAPSNILTRLQNLEKLEIRDCSALHELFKMDGQLEKLKFSDGNSMQLLPSLKEVSLSTCKKLIHLFPYAIARTLSKLESLEISNCESMHEVVSKEDRDEEQVLVAMSFPNLRVLELGGGSLRTFIQTLALDDDDDDDATTQLRVNSSSHSLFDDKVEFPNLEKMQLSCLNIYKVWNDEVHYPSDSFSRLKDLDIEECPNLETIAPSNILTRLQNLEKLAIRECIALHEFFKMEGQLNQEDAKGRGIDFEKLEDARYYDCPALASRMPIAVLGKFREEPEYFL